MNQKISEKRARADRLLDRRIFELLNKRFLLDFDEEMSLRELNGSGKLPVVFAAIHLYGGLHPWELFKHPTTQDRVWDMFKTLKEDYPDDMVGVAFNTSSDGRWILHNALELKERKEGRRLLCNLSNHPFIVEKFNQFCNALKENLS